MIALEADGCETAIANTFCIKKEDNTINNNMEF